ncbi:MAG TPA: hypothetical protein VGZ50_08930, partial [Actinomycetota bacterium]|nr:hypothetical protein [Actinomycetota bacterium]
MMITSHLPPELQAEPRAQGHAARDGGSERAGRELKLADASRTWLEEAAAHRERATSTSRRSWRPSWDIG